MLRIVEAGNAVNSWNARRIAPKPADKILNKKYNILTLNNFYKNGINIANLSAFENII
jgi:hypothetical protein